jgi:hypothetical protein
MREGRHVLHVEVVRGRQVELASVECSQSKCAQPMQPASNSHAAHNNPTTACVSCGGV